MDPAERLFLNLLADYTAEDIRYAISADIDLAKLVQEELPEYVQPFKEATRAYVRAHPNAREALKDMPAAARRVVSLLKTYRPHLGYEIELFRELPTAASTGFKIKGGAQEQVQNARGNAHVGYSWVEMNLKRLTGLLL